MAISIEIPKHSPQFQKQVAVHLGVVALYAVAFTALLFIAALFAGSLNNWERYVSLGICLFIFFYFESAFLLGIYNKNRAWGKYTIDEAGIVVEKSSQTTTYTWERFEKYSVSSLTTLKSDLNFNERFFPKIVRLERIENMYVVQLFVASQRMPFLEVPVRTSDLVALKAILDVHLKIR